MLEVAGIAVRFGGHTALDGIAMKFERGKVTGVIGPNGAGKTTMFNVISGFQPTAGGTLKLDGTEIIDAPPHERARMGLARTFQRLELFGALTVRRNIEIAASARRLPKAERDGLVDSLLQRLGLTESADLRAATLPTGTGRMVELARALAIEPRVLLLDEPASGQDDAETQLFDDVLRDLAREGMAVALVEHDIALVMRVCDHVYVLDRGRLIGQGRPAEVQADKVVQDAYLGAVA